MNGGEKKEREQMNDVTTNDERRMSEVLERSREELLGLPAESLGQANVQRSHAMVLTRTVLTNFQLIEPGLDDELSAGRAARVRVRARGLTDRVLAFFAADLAREQLEGTQQDLRIELGERVFGHDRYLLKWAWPLFGDDPVKSEILADIQRGRGVQDDAEDVIRLVGMFRTHWDQADGQTPVTRDYLTRAETDATELITLLEADSQDSKRDLARRAFTAWRDDYREIMFLGRYLLRGSSNVSELFPGIRPPRSTPARPRPVGPEPVPAPGDDDPVAGEAEATSEESASDASSAA